MPFPKTASSTTRSSTRRFDDIDCRRFCSTTAIALGLRVPILHDDYSAHEVRNRVAPNEKDDSKRISEDKRALQQYTQAFDALARLFKTKWQSGNAPEDATIEIGGKTVNITATVACPKRQPNRRPRLRFDKVALRFARQVSSSVSALVPPGHTQLIAVTAPIRSAAKTASQLSEFLTAASHGKPSSDFDPDDVNGNVISLLTAPVPTDDKVVVFVHNADVDGYDVLFTAEMLLTVMSKDERVRTASGSRERWLVLVNLSAGVVEACRVVCPHLPRSRYARVFATTDQGRLRELSTEQGF